MWGGGSNLIDSQMRRLQQVLMLRSGAIRLIINSVEYGIND